MSPLNSPSTTVGAVVAVVVVGVILAQPSILLLGLFNQFTH